MIYKNSLKILISNFDIVWKTILYYIFVFFVMGGMVYLCVNPIYKLLEQSGFVENITTVYADFLTNLNFTQLLLTINDLILQFVSILTENLSSVWINFVGLGFVFIFLKTYLSNLTIMPSCNALHYYMGSMNKHSYVLSFKETFGKNLKAQLAYFIVSLPLKILYAFLFVLSLRLFNISFVMSILSVFLIAIGFCILLGFKYTLFAGWIPTMVVMNYGVFKALKVSVKNSFRIFPRVFSNAIGIVITLVLSNFVIGIFTFMAGLIITIPFSYLLISSFGMVVTFEAQGMRYYVDVYNVITPKKKEISDKLNSMKYIV